MYRYQFIAVSLLLAIQILVVLHPATAFVGPSSSSTRTRTRTRTRHSFQQQSHPGVTSTARQNLIQLQAGAPPTTSAEIEGNATPISAESLSFEDLCTAAQAASTLPREAVTSTASHDPFRFEWGTWVDNDAMLHLMDMVNTVRVRGGAYDNLVALAASQIQADDHSPSPQPPRFRLAGGKDWDAFLHILPPNGQRRHRWPTGSWSVVKPLIGVVEVSLLRGPDRNTGVYRKTSKKDLRGGGDGSILGGGGGKEDDAGLSTDGEACVKYVGGPLRAYEGKSSSNLVLEVTVRPPNAARGPIDVDGSVDDALPMTQDQIDKYLALVSPPDEEEETESEEQDTVTAQDGTTEELPAKKSLADRLDVTFDKVGGLDAQLDSIVRRVLASRANPEAAKRLGVNHVRGILLSGPPGCGKTLLARELSNLLGAREPQIVNGPEILDKFVGEAEKRVRALFAPAEQEYKQVGDASALHVIILDEMDAIARKRGSMTSDTTGIRDSVVNQLLAKMDGVREANNILVVGLTNRPELLDPALLRPGRLEVHLRVELPDSAGRRDILRIHTRSMKEAGGISDDAEAFIEDLGENGLPEIAEHYTGAELAGLVRSAASFALARAVEEGDGADGLVTKVDLKEALTEVRPALGRQDAVLKARYPYGISPCSSSMKRVMRDLDRFTAPPVMSARSESTESILLVGSGISGGSGATALAAHAAATSTSDFVQFVTALDLLVDGGSGVEGRAAALAAKFAETRDMPGSLLVLDDIDQICAGSGPNGYSSTMISTLRALLRTPPASSAVAKAGGGQSSGSKDTNGKHFRVIAATSQANAACSILHECFDQTVVVPQLVDTESIRQLFSDSFIQMVGGGNAEMDTEDLNAMADMIASSFPDGIGVKTALRFVEKTIAIVGLEEGTLTNGEVQAARLSALKEIIDDFTRDEAVANAVCNVSL